MAQHSTEQLSSNTKPENILDQDQLTMKILVSLNSTERAAFLPKDNLEEQIGLPGTYELIDSQATDSDTLMCEIESHHPEILIASWSTPKLLTPTDGSLPVPYLCYLSGSIKNCVPRALIERGLTVSNWGTSISRYVAECAMTLTLATLRNIGTHQHAMRQNYPWRYEHMTETSLFNRKIGLHGLGAIAREYLQIVKPFNVQCTAWDPFVSETQMAEIGVQPAASLQELYANNDVVVVFCALTDQTRNIIDDTLLRQLPEKATFVNVARGELVDEPALIQVLKEGRIRAGLDVFREEPLPNDSELRQLDNVVLMPHLGGFTCESRAYALSHSIRNIQRYARKEPLQSVIGLEQFDRMS